MHLDLFAFYAGPDQVMTVTSGLASILGLLLIFWNKVVAGFHKLMDKFRRSPAPAPVVAQNETSAEKSQG